MLMNWLRSSVAYEFMADGILIEFDGGHKKNLPLNLTRAITVQY